MWHLQNLLLLSTSAFEFEIFFRGGADKVYTWRDAKNFCQNLKDGWQLIVIDSPEKQAATEKAFFDAGATPQDAAWLGYTNRDGWAANSANAKNTLDIFGNRARYLNYAEDEPNNKRGNPADERGEDCVRMRIENFEGKAFWEDALCGRRFAGIPSQKRITYHNSFICEPRPDEDLGSCIPEPTGKIPISTQYHVEPASTLSFNEARTACQNRGFNWDLVIFDSDEELQYIKKMINCLPEAFWVGYRENNGKSMDLFGKPAQIVMPWLVNKENGEADEPNEPDGECVRMRDGKMNDAVCTRSYSGPMRIDIGMGYVCERHTSILPGLTNANSRTENTCEQNVWGIKPFRRIPGCAQPAYCQAEMEVIDAWTRADQNSGKVLFGFAVQIKLTAEFIAANTNTGYSILIRFPDTVKRASFQSWNLNFFNFYNGGTEVLMHSKYYTALNLDNFDPDLNSYILVVENMNVKTHPVVLAFPGRQKNHNCFNTGGNSHSRTSAGFANSSIRDLAQEIYGNEITLDNISSFSFNQKGLSKVKAKAPKIDKL